jgi:YD repeat-containing protein
LPTLFSATYTAKEQTRYNFNSSGLLTSVAAPDGLTRSLSYSNGKLSTITEPDGGIGTFLYDGSGLLSGVLEPGNRTLTVTHDGSGNLSTLTNPDGSLRTFLYDSAHHLISDQFGPTLTTISYNGLSGDATTVQLDPASALGISPANAYGLNPYAGSSYPYYVAPNAPAVGVATDPDNHVATYTLDSFDRLTREQLANGALYQYQRDFAGQVACPHFMYPAL